MVRNRHGPGAGDDDAADIADATLSVPLLPTRFRRSEGSRHRRSAASCWVSAVVLPAMLLRAGTGERNLLTGSLSAPPRVVVARPQEVELEFRGERRLELPVPPAEPTSPAQAAFRAS